MTKLKPVRDLNGEITLKKKWPNRHSPLIAIQTRHVISLNNMSWI